MLVRPAAMLLVLPVLSLATGCGAGDIDFAGYGAAFPDGLPGRPTWKNDVLPRMDYYCGGCHGERTQKRGLKLTDYRAYFTDKPAENVKLPDGSTCRDKHPSQPLVRSPGPGVFVRPLKVQIVDERSMPPGGAPKMTPRDWAMIEKWATVAAGCDEECPDPRCWFVEQ